jgi:hypothetical protein
MIWFAALLLMNHVSIEKLASVKFAMPVVRLRAAPTGNIDVSCRLLQHVKMGSLLKNSHARHEELFSRFAARTSVGTMSTKGSQFHRGSCCAKVESSWVHLTVGRFLVSSTGRSDALSMRNWFVAVISAAQLHRRGKEQDQL